MLSITTTSGQRFDLYPNETIEVNMGGISLLNLSDRTVSYTNSFKLPRTPNNESIFAFASHPTRNNRPSINVIITKGLFQKTATLKVKAFTGDYNCEVVYDNGVLDLLSSTTIDTLFDDGKTWENDQPSGNDEAFAGLDAYINFESFRPVTYKYSDSGSLLSTILDLFSTKYTITFNGTLFDDNDFGNLFMILPYLNRTYTSVKDPNNNYYHITVTQHKTTVPNLISVSTLLKAISQLFMCDVKIDGRTITINKVAFPSGINIETLSFTKTIYSGYLNQNNIVYDLKDTSVSPLFGADTFIADGVGNKDVLKLGISVPLAYGTNPKLYDTESIQDLQIYKAVNGTYPFLFNGTTYTNISDYNASILTMSGYYSTVLNPIFANPVILSATGYIDPLTADTIMNDRVIISVKLGGRYWVDDMKYNLTTGNSVLKLIKL